MDRRLPTPFPMIPLPALTLSACSGSTGSDGTVAPGLVQSISAGTRHSCAVTGDGTGYCWGQNHLGELGDGTLENRLEPTPVHGDFRWQSISLGTYFTCGLSDSGEVYCWGSNLAAMLLPTAGSENPIPTRIDLPEAGVALDVGSFHACAVGRSGSAYAGAATAGVLSGTEPRKTPLCRFRWPPTSGSRVSPWASTMPVARRCRGRHSAGEGVGGWGTGPGDSAGFPFRS